MLETSKPETRPSVCPLDCPDTCSLSATTDGDRLIDVRGSTANPYTEGVICNKVARSYPEFVHGADRLTQPMKRAGARGEFEQVSWDEALDLVLAGFSNAIEVRIQPDDADWDAGDIRYNVIRWTSSPNPPFGGYGPVKVNPRTSQIIGSDIMLEQVFMTNRVRYDRMFDPGSATDVPVQAGLLPGQRG